MYHMDFKEDLNPVFFLHSILLQEYTGVFVSIFVGSYIRYLNSDLLADLKSEFQERVKINLENHKQIPCVIITD